jgi:transcription-repair coupling factor (superfamily II helicase)
VIQLVQTRRHFKLAGQDRLRIEKPIANLRERVLEIRAVLRDLTPMSPADVASKLGGNNVKKVAA